MEEPCYFSQIEFAAFVLQMSAKLYNWGRCSVALFSCLVSECLSCRAGSKFFVVDLCLPSSEVHFHILTELGFKVSCKQLQRPVDACESSQEQANGLSMNTSFMLEIKGSVLPPWVVWRVCAAIQQLQPGNFEAR